MDRWWATMGGLVFAACSGGGTLEPPAVPLSTPNALCSAAQPANCVPPKQVERTLRSAPLEILQTSDTPGGLQGAKVLTLKSGDWVFRAKWRPASSGDLLNEPRKELAAYAVNKLLAEDIDMVVPPTAARCLPLAAYRAVVDDEAEPHPGTECVLGYLSYWVPGATVVKDAHEEGLLVGGRGLVDIERIRSDWAYRISLSHLNLLTYAIHHADAHAKQFILVPGMRGVVVYSVDNSVAFRSIKNPMVVFRQDWSQWLLPDILASQVARMKDLGEEDFERLQVVQELQLDDGVLIDVPSGAPIGDLGDSVREQGDRVQVGLTEGEIDGVRNRIGDLLDRIEDGDIRVGGF
ncbi:MAG: hypothetical protein ACOC1F_07565 [Myxococcota bacterium]